MIDDSPETTRQATARAILADRLRPFARPRVAGCRRTRVSSEVQVHKHADGGLSLHGLSSCRSPWSCPICAAKIAAARATEVQFACEAWRLAGGHVSMLTLTIRHGIGDDLRTLRKGLANAWRRLWQGTRGRRIRSSLGVRHYVRAAEVTHGDANGWHPHLHILLFTTRRLDDEDASLAYDAWWRCVDRELGAGCIPDAEHGLTLTPAHLDTYIAKLGLEVGSITTKRGRNGSRSPWQVAQDAADGCERSRSLWVDYGSAMFGARQLTWSRGTRRYFGLREDDDDGVLAEELEVGTPVACWTAESWDARKRESRFFISRVVEAMGAELPLARLADLGGTDLEGKVGIVKVSACSSQAREEWIADNSHRLPPTTRRQAVAVYSPADRVWSKIDFRTVQNLA